MIYQHYPHLRRQGYESRVFDLGAFLNLVVSPPVEDDRDDIPLATYLTESPDADGLTYGRSSFSHMWALQVDYDSGLPFEEDFTHDRVLYASPRNMTSHVKFRAWIPLATPLDLCVLDNPAVRSYLYSRFPGSDEGVTRKTFQRHRLPGRLSDPAYSYWYDVRLRGDLWDASAELTPIHLENPMVTKSVTDVGPMTMSKRVIMSNLRQAVKAHPLERATGLHDFLLRTIGEARSCGLPEEAAREIFADRPLPDLEEFERVLKYFYEK